MRRTRVNLLYILYSIVYILSLLWNATAGQKNSILPSKKKLYASRIKIDLQIKLFSARQFAFLSLRLPEQLKWYPLSHTTDTEYEVICSKPRFHFYEKFTFPKHCNHNIGVKARQDKRKTNGKWCATLRFSRSSISS